MNLTEFLLARIAEDEELAREVHARRCDTPAALTVLDDRGRSYVVPCDCDRHIGRVLAECEAKRRIVEELRDVVGEEDVDVQWASQYGDRAQQVAIATLRLLALPYADHDDYRPEWRP